MVVVDGGHGHLSHAEERLRWLEARWSRFDSASDVSRMNEAPGHPVAVTEETVCMVERAVEAWRLTGGSFDPMILPSLIAAGYATSVEDSEAVSLMAAPAVRGPAPGCGAIVIDRRRHTVTLPPAGAFDPGGIGKGLAADMTVGTLLGMGADGAMVSVGGDVRASGEAPTHAGWVVGLEDPSSPVHLIRSLALGDGAVATSSTLSRSWMKDGERVHHLIDPATGRCAASGIVSVTVLAAEAWIAEAFSKASMLTDPVSAVLGLERAGLAGVVVDSGGLIQETESMGRFAA